MLLKDKIYGAFGVNDPVIRDLLKCEDLTRLKHVSQSGLACFGLGYATDYTRFEHSLGVMLLLRRLGADLEEQVAGLLHDSSHTAFSHVIDHAFGNTDKENYADTKLGEFIANSKIGKILKKHGFDSERISGYEEHGYFTLLEMPIPDLCADRVDNGLRYMSHAGIDASRCVHDMRAEEGRIVFASEEAAGDFAYGYLKGTKEDWGNPEAGLRAYFLSEALRRGIGSNKIRIEDFYSSTEEEIIKELRKKKDASIRNNLSQIGKDLRFRLDGKGRIRIKSKVRYVDPVFIKGGERYRLSSVDKRYKKAVSEEIRILRKGFRIRIG